MVVCDDGEWKVSQGTQTGFSDLVQITASYAEVSVTWRSPGRGPRCVHGLQMCAWSTDVCMVYRCVHGLQMCAWSTDVCMVYGCVHGLQMCAWSTDVCMVYRCVHGLQMCAWSTDVCMVYRCCTESSLSWGTRDSRWISTTKWNSVILQMLVRDKHHF